MSVGIIMPYYNEKELLAKAVQAVINQSYTDWKLYLVDDGSREENKASKVIPNDPRITLIEKINYGVSVARNTAMAYIKEDYVAYCDADDMWDKDYLQKQVDFISQGYDFVYSNVRHCFVDGSTAIPYGIANYPEYPGLETLYKGNFIFISGVLHKKECLIVGGFDMNLNGIEDWDYWIRIAAAGYKIAKNDSACFTYTVKLSGGNGAQGNKFVYEALYKKHRLL